MTTKPTARQVDETKMIAAWFSEAATEIVAMGDVPAPVAAAIRARVNAHFDSLVGEVGVLRAVATFAAVAFEAGRKAERAGLAHEPTGEETR